MKNFSTSLSIRRCSCCGKNGKKKKLYPDYTTAMENAYYAKETRKAILHVYKCPEGLGYHLTSNEYQY